MANPSYNTAEEYAAKSASLYNYFTISPVRGYNRMEGAMIEGLKNDAPTEIFEVELRSANESFRKSVTGMAELVAVVRDVFGRNIAAKKLVDKAYAKMQQQNAAMDKTNKLLAIKQHREAIAHLEKTLED